VAILVVTDCQQAVGTISSLGVCNTVLTDTFGYKLTMPRVDDDVDWVRWRFLWVWLGWVQKFRVRLSLKKNWPCPNSALNIAYRTAVAPFRQTELRRFVVHNGSRKEKSPLQFLNNFVRARSTCILTNFGR